MKELEQMKVHAPPSISHFGTTKRGSSSPPPFFSLSFNSKTLNPQTKQKTKKQKNKKQKTVAAPTRNPTKTNLLDVFSTDLPQDDKKKGLPVIPNLAPLLMEKEGGERSSFFFFLF